LARRAPALVEDGCICERPSSAMSRSIAARRGVRSCREAQSQEIAERRRAGAPRTTAQAGTNGRRRIDQTRPVLIDSATNMPGSGRPLWAARQAKAAHRSLEVHDLPGRVGTRDLADGRIAIRREVETCTGWEGIAPAPANPSATRSWKFAIAAKPPPAHATSNNSAYEETDLILLQASTPPASAGASCAASRRRCARPNRAARTPPRSRARRRAPAWRRRPQSRGAAAPRPWPW
jgi:hypothetical protein